MSKAVAIVFCLDVLQDQNDLPLALKCVGGIPALDNVLEVLRRMKRLNDIFIVCKESSYTRYFANYCNVRNIPLTHLIAYKYDKIISILHQYDKSVLLNSNDPLTKNVFIDLGHEAMISYTNDNAVPYCVMGKPYIPSIERSPEEINNGEVMAVFCWQVGESGGKSVSSTFLNSTEGFNAADLAVRQANLNCTQSLPILVEEKCHARIGMMGNPSDGFNGKTLSFLIENFAASVKIEGRPLELGIDIVEPLHFTRLDDLHLQSNLIGYSTGSRLLQATCKVFSQHCFKNNLTIHMKRGFTMTYSTDIPRMVGLSGSSAIIVAAFRALLKFFGLTLNDLHIELYDFPQHILDIERIELGISAGLQDRVIQTYGGVVHMDFTKPSTDPSRYTRINAALLPPMYLAYDACAGGDSGKVHSTVKDRWANKDPELVDGMKTLGSLADSAKQCLEAGHHDQLARLMEANFAMRRKLYGDAVVGAKNIRMVELAAAHGLSAKFTGSGGALLCMRSDGQGWLSVAEEEKLTAAYKEQGFNFVRIRIPSV